MSVALPRNTCNINKLAWAAPAKARTPTPTPTSTGLWNDVFELAQESAEINMQWQKLGTIDERVFNFEEQVGQPLLGLRLIGRRM